MTRSRAEIVCISLQAWAVAQLFVALAVHGSSPGYKIFVLSCVALTLVLWLVVPRMAGRLRATSFGFDVYSTKLTFAALVIALIGPALYFAASHQGSRTNLMLLLCFSGYFSSYLASHVYGENLFRTLEAEDED